VVKSRSHIGSIVIRKANYPQAFSTFTIEASIENAAAPNNILRKTNIAYYLYQLAEFTDDRSQSGSEKMMIHKNMTEFSLRNFRNLDFLKPG
jgi:hypothetical protein